MPTTCPACALQLPTLTPFCPSCGRPLTTGSDPTIEADPGPAAAPVTRDATDNKFLPGTILAGRYRIVALAGRGGMGDVYRADDLRLGQAVALKFLPPDARRDPRALERFHAEIRLARQITHPNVCRLYDISDLGRELFLTMEYIDGEDLGTLLRRIGRLPHAKAVDIVRQLCAGLAAAHACGVLHRDLKPANVMIDGRGQVRITDFGIAGRTTDAPGPELLGTPAYLAPEQLAGAPATIASDVYALGLVMYETFTGQPAFEAASLLDRVTAGYTPPPRPSSVVGDMSPAIERVVMQCLARDAAERPTPVLAVAAALPGGDPLAAAFAAGETPSPELVAAGGQAGGLSPAVGWTLLLGIVLSLAIVAVLADRVSLVRMTPLENAPGALSERVSQIVARAGYQLPVDSAWGFDADLGYAALVSAQTRGSVDRRAAYRRGPTASLYYWERHSPLPLTAARGIVTVSDPPLDVPGMVRVLLDGSGLLRRLDAVPPDNAAGAGRSVDWPMLFEAAGLRISEFVPAVPLLRPAVHTDERHAWSGHYPGRPDVAVHLEGAGLQGYPILFAVGGPWSEDTSQPGHASVPVPFVIAPIVMLIVGLAAGIPLVRRNVRLGRGDLRGAKHLAAAVLALSLAGSVLQLHATATLDHARALLDGAALAVFSAAIAWLAYVAIEPYIRRQAPHLITSWTRLLSGRWRDPLVGRDILIGVLAASGTLAVTFAIEAVGSTLGRPAPMPVPILPGMLGPPVAYAGQVLVQISYAPIAALGRLLLLVLLAALFRRWWAAVVVFILLHVLVVLLGTQQYQTPVSAIVAGIILAVVLVRFGLLASPVHGVLFIGMLHLPVTFDLSSGYMLNAAFLVVLASALAIFGFLVATAGRPRLGRALLDAG